MLYFLDTNTLIDILDGQKNVGANFIKKFADNEIKIPDIAYYEVLRGFEYKDSKNQKAKFENFCKLFQIQYMDLQTLRIAANQWANLKKNGTPLDDDGDILIGSLALRHNAILVTNNTKHLSKITGIQLENWQIQKN